MNQDGEMTSRRRELLNAAVNSTSDTQKGRTRVWIRIPLVFVVVFVVGVLYWKVLASDDSSVAADVQVDSSTGVDLEFEDVSARAHGGGELQASGYIVAMRKATVSADTTGRLVKVHFDEGASIEKGELLAELDSRRANAEIELARANLVVSQKAVESTQTLIDEAEADLLRLEPLFDKNFVSEEVLYAARFKLKSLEAAKVSDIEKVAAARRHLDVSRQNLENTRIYAPFAGIVTSADAHVGEIVSPISAGGGFTRTGICTLVDMDSLEGEININERYVNRVFDFQKVEATTRAYPETVFHGEVVSVAPVVERNTAAVKVRVKLVDPERRLLPGMRVDVHFGGV